MAHIEHPNARILLTLNPDKGVFRKTNTNPLSPSARDRGSPGPEALQRQAAIEAVLVLQNEGWWRGVIGEEGAKLRLINNDQPKPPLVKHCR